jgi:type IV fimbrial biogenesis protein FimT
MHLARNTAITTNLRVTMCASASGTNCEVAPWNSGWIVFIDPNSNGNLDGAETIVTASAAVDGLAIQSGEFPQSLMYRPNGRAMLIAITGNSGEFSVCDHRGVSHAKVIVVDLSGRPRLSKYNADGTPPNCI